jgi:hypothetical protein
MQLFILDANPEKAAELHCDKHMNQLKECAQILYTALSYMGFPVDSDVVLPDGTCAKPYQPVWPHPCVHWAAACVAHLDWCVNLGTALSKQYSNRYCNRVHLCSHHIDHIKAHINLVRDRLPPPPHGPYTWLESLSESARASCEPRLALDDIPNGCLFGILAMDPEFYVSEYNIDDEKLVSCVKSYRRFYVHKAANSFAMEWAHSKQLPFPLRASKHIYFSGVALLERPVPLSKKRRLDLSADTANKQVSVSAVSVV